MLRNEATRVTPSGLFDALGNEEFIHACRASGIDESKLGTLTGDDLEKLGISTLAERNLLLWSIREAPGLANWLSTLGLEQYLKNFLSNGIDLATGRSLSSEDLLEIGITPLGHRKILLGVAAPQPKPETVDAEVANSRLVADQERRHEASVRPNRGTELTEPANLGQRPRSDELDTLTTRMADESESSLTSQKPDDLDVLETTFVPSRAPASPEQPFTSSPEAGAPTTPVIGPGAVLDGKLLIVRKIGQGGMGVVYEAIDTRTEVRYAVKVLTPDLAARSDALSAFRREVAIAQGLTHQNILKVNYFVDDGPSPYLVMEHLDGEDLSSLLARRAGPLAEDEAIAILEQVANGLDYLHDKGLVHLDVKPQNIFVLRSGEVRILDFGIANVARALHLGSNGSSGTLAYMAPEQLRQQPVDRRTDVYAFGLVCLQVLTGTLPFDLRDPEQVVAWHLNPKHEIPGVQESLNRVLTAMTAVSPDRRPTLCKGAVQAARPQPPLRAEASTADKPQTSEMVKPPSPTSPMLDALNGISPILDAWTGITRRFGKKNLILMVVLPPVAMLMLLLVFVVFVATFEFVDRTTSKPTEPDPSVQSTTPPSEASPSDSVRPVDSSEPGTVSVPVKLVVKSTNEIEAKSDVRPLNHSESTFPEHKAKFDRMTTECDRGLLRSCHELGASHRRGLLGVAKDPVKAQGFYERACAGGFLASCGVLADFGLGRDKDLDEAVGLYRKACDAGEPIGCKNLGIQYAIGEGVEKDLSEAVRLYRKACDAGEPIGCSALGVQYANGEGVEKDLSEAVRLYRKACDAGEPTGCNNLGAQYSSGEGVEKDPSEAARLHRMACDAGEPMGCHNLGRQYLKGEGVDMDRAGATTLFLKACDAGLGLACWTLKSLP